MAESNQIEVEGRVVAVLPGTMFKVQLANQHVVLAHISGKLRKNFIKIAAGNIERPRAVPAPEYQGRRQRSNDPVMVRPFEVIGK